MDKNVLVNLDLQPVADIANNIMNKIADAVGWIATPKGSVKNRIESEQYLIEKIESDENIPPLAKAAMISKVKRIIKEYCNINDIVSLAMSFLSKNANADNVSVEWLNEFFDKFKNISDKELQVILGKILAGEFDSDRHTPVKLFSALLDMGKEDAKMFRNICKFAIRDVEQDLVLVIFGYPIPEEIYLENGVDANALSRMEELGLIKGYELSRYSDYIDIGEKKIYTYHDKIIKVMQQNDEHEIDFGNISFTEAGMTLADIITPMKVNEFPIFWSESIRDNDLYVEVLPKKE